MNSWLSWTVPPAIVMTAASPLMAAQYMTVEQAQKAAFPDAVKFTPADVIFTPDQAKAIEQLTGQKLMVRGEQVWKVEDKSGQAGYFILDYVIGKHLIIDYAVSLSPQGAVRKVDILEYRESYGGEVAGADWLDQFKGKTPSDSMEPGEDIRIISGATLSSRHVTEGVKKVLAIYAVCLK